MKKILTLILMMGLIVLTPHPSFAYQEEDLIGSRNLLNLSNLSVDPSTEMATTIQPIDVFADETHTLILSFDFVGQWEGYLDMFQLGIRSMPSTDYIDYAFVRDDAARVFYVEFTPTSNQIMIREIPVSPATYHAILIRGTYQSYEGFTPYLDPTTSLITNKVLLMDYDNRMTIQEIGTYIQAKSAQGDLISYDIIDDGFTTANQLPGTYHITYMALHDHVHQYLNLEVRILDITAPVMSFEGSKVTIPLATKWAMHEITSLITISDNVDVLDQSDLTIVSDTYSGASTVGNYQITFEIKDLSGNTSTLYMPIELADMKGPVIDGPDFIFIYTEDEPFTYEQIFGYFNIMDDVDGENVINTVITDQYMQTKIPGQYLVQIESKDMQNNVTQRNIMIHVVNNSAPVFDLSDLFLEVSTVESMTDQELIDWFKASLLSSGITADQVDITFNEYEMQKDKAGNYYVYMSYTVGGEKHLSRITMQVNETDDAQWYQTYLWVFAIPLIGVGVLVFKKMRK